MTAYFHEVRKEVVRKNVPILVRVGQPLPPAVYNFRSTFDYPTEVAQKIRDAGNTAGLKGLPVSCDTIYIDVDNNEDIEEVRDKLVGAGWAVDEYSTGNRGAHFHIPLGKRITGVNVIYTVTSWLKQQLIWHLIDTSIYREGGQYRLETAIHTKTGNSKKLVNEFDGNLLELEMQEPPTEPLIVYVPEEEKTRRDFNMNLLLKRGVGQRHTHLWICWKSGVRAGLTYEELTKALISWNERQDEPHDEALVMKKIKSFNTQGLN